MGGGGGGGRNLSKDELSFLEKKAKEALKGSQPEKRNIFISFDSGDLDKVNLLRGQAANEDSNLEFNDYSLKEPFDSKKSEYIKRGIRERIRQSSVTICYLSDKTADSQWVDWEIRESKAMGKGVIGVYQGDRSPSRLPKAITDLKIKVIPWNQKLINQEIDRAAGNREGAQ
jgi:hypothetical protein